MEHKKLSIRRRRIKLHLPVTLAVTMVGPPCRAVEGGECLGAPSGDWGGSGEECEEREWAEWPFYRRGRAREGVLAVAMANGWQGQASGVT
jgi:hypothetical protein